jgi:hypothetical protein
MRPQQIKTVRNQRRAQRLLKYIDPSYASRYEQYKQTLDDLLSRNSRPISLYSLVQDSLKQNVDW